MPDRDLRAAHRFFDQHAFPRVGVRDRIVLAPIAKQTVFGHLPPASVAGVVIRLAYYRTQRFFSPACQWLLARRTVWTRIDFFGPKPGLRVEVVERCELDPGPEVLFQKTDGRFDLAFR